MASDVTNQPPRVATEASTVMGGETDIHASTGPQRPLDGDSEPRTPRIALLGNPNTGKTTLFNRLSGLRHKTSNFPGTTLDARVGRIRLEGPRARAAAGPCCGPEHEAPRGRPGDQAASLELIDLPGVYSLELDQAEASVCRAVLGGESAPKGEDARVPDALCVVLDATNLGRNLMLAGEALRRRLPTVVAVNMIDLARKKGLSIDRQELAERLGCAVVLVSARTAEGLAELRRELATPRYSTRTPPGDEAGLRNWAEEIYAAVGELSDPDAANDSFTDRLDRVFTHPVLGVATFLLIMGALFYTLFSLAQYPMEWIDAIFHGKDSLVAAWQPEWLRILLGGGMTGLINHSMPEGVLRELLAVGIVGGICGTVVFLPQICLLFFLISLLEDTGYLARAAFVADRVLRPFGLPGHAFVPLLSSHACALPGIMATRAIPDRRERLATILVAPFMTCSARLPVYVLVTTILFVGRPMLAAVAFIGCYALGMIAGVLSALVARRTILRGASRAMALELPTYKLPSIRTALLTTSDRALTFLKNAGTNIMMICIVLWWLGSYPKVDPPARATELRQQAAALEATEPQMNPLRQQAVSPLPGQAPGDELVPSDERARIEELRREADQLEASNAQAQSFMGRAGRTIEPIFRPLGYDWQLTVGVLTSFAAREVFVSTMSVVLAGEDDVEGEGVMERIQTATRDDNVTPVFSRATCWSLLVFFVLAMQCLPTLAVTARESGHVKWAFLQLGWMTLLAYVGAAIAYFIAGGWGGA